jgi:hypothetical protein
LEKAAPTVTTARWIADFFAAAGLEAESLRKFIATGADDHEVSAWMSDHARASKQEIIDWGRSFRTNRLWRLLEI